MTTSFDEALNVDIKPRKTKTEDAEMDITPMIDIVFLLLAFFVMCSKMDPTVQLNLPRAQYGVSVPEKSCVVLLAALGEAPETFTIYKGRRKEDEFAINSSDPETIETEVAKFVESELAMHPDAQGVLIKAEGEIRTGTIEVIKRGIAGSDLARTREIFMAVEEGK